MTAWHIAGTEYELPEDDMLAVKQGGVINKEQHNKLLIKCAFVCSLYI
jgi:hypothetical protein